MEVERMNRNQFTKSIVVFGFLALLVVTAAGSVGAFEDQTSECGTSGCHDTSGVLTLSSNSTSVSATTGESFVLQISAGNGAEWLAIKSGWADNSDFTISAPNTEDDSADDTNAATGEITVDVTFTPLSPGTLTIRVWTAAAGDLASSLDIEVTVTGESVTTNTEPTSQPIDLYATWVSLMIWVPLATAGILFLLGIIAFRGKIE